MNLIDVIILLLFKVLYWKVKGRVFLCIFRIVELFESIMVCYLKRKKKFINIFYVNLRLGNNLFFVIKEELLFFILD